MGVVGWWLGVLEGRLAALEGGLVRGGGVSVVYCGPSVGCELYRASLGTGR